MPEIRYVRNADPALTAVLEQRVQDGGLVMAHLPPVRKDLRPAQILVCSKAVMDQDFLEGPFQARKTVAGDTLEWLVVTDGPNGAVAYGRPIPNALAIAAQWGAASVHYTGTEPPEGFPGVFSRN